MDHFNTKPLIHSNTFQWLLATLIVYLIQQFGLPALPPAVQGEMVKMLSIGLDFTIPLMLAMAARGRMKAEVMIKSVF